MGNVMLVRLWNVGERTKEQPQYIKEVEIHEFKAMEEKYPHHRIALLGRWTL